MKSQFNTYITLFLLAICTTFSACDKEMVEPVQIATSTEASQRAPKFVAGDYIVQFQNDSTLQLNTNQDIELLAESIAGAELTFTDIFNFEGFKGFTGYLTKQQARKFYFDSRVLVIELDTPIGPLTSKPETEETEELIML